MDYINKVNELRQKNSQDVQENEKETRLLSSITQTSKEIVDSIEKEANLTRKVEVANDKTSDVVGAISTVGRGISSLEEKLTEAFSTLASLNTETSKTLETALENASRSSREISSQQSKEVQNAFTALSSKVGIVKGGVKVTNTITVNDLSALLKAVQETNTLIKSKDYKPKIEIKESKEKVDLTRVEKLLEELITKEVQLDIEKNEIVFPREASEALPVRLVTPNGKEFYKATGGGGGGGLSSPYRTETNSQAYPVLESGAIPTVSGLVPKVFDTIQITSYNANDDPLVVVYRTGGAAGTVVATLTMTYSGTNITEVVRT